MEMKRNRRKGYRHDGIGEKGGGSVTMTRKGKWKGRHGKERKGKAKYGQARNENVERRRRKETGKETKGKGGERKMGRKTE